uniref:KRAB domain-containing protein n=1 Tax=Laticauda laticaudata TaxID=8630 RepID=A0A8C5WVL4_LATLA
MISALLKSKTLKSLVSFEEVAVYFSEEEWSQLDPDQKALHSEVMLENHRNGGLLLGRVSLYHNFKKNDLIISGFLLFKKHSNQILSPGGRRKESGLNFRRKNHLTFYILTFSLTLLVIFIPFCFKVK